MDDGAETTNLNASNAFSTVTRRHACGHDDREAQTVMSDFESRRPTRREATTARQRVSTASVTSFEEARMTRA